MVRNIKHKDMEYYEAALSYVINLHGYGKLSLKELVLHEDKLMELINGYETLKNPENEDDGLINGYETLKDLIDCYKESNNIEKKISN